MTAAGTTATEGTAEMETVRCLLCGHEKSTPRVRGWDRMCGVEGEYTLSECANCGFLFLSPRPDAEEIKRHYPENYPVYNSVFDQPDYVRSIAEYDFDKRCETVINAALDGRNVLDIGCAVGDFLATMKGKGWDARGVEPNSCAAAYAAERHGLDIYNGFVEDASFEPGSFDAVTMWEVLEHTPQPLDTLRHVYDLLRPGGAVVLSVPNRNSIQSKVFGTYWIGNDFPRHYSVFSPRHMRQALRTAGFIGPKIMSQRGRLGAMHNEIIFLVSSIGLWINDSDSSRGMRRVVNRTVVPVITKPAGIIPFYIATLPASFAIRKLHRGSQMVAIAHKPAA